MSNGTRHCANRPGALSAAEAQEKQLGAAIRIGYQQHRRDRGEEQRLRFKLCDSF